VLYAFAFDDCCVITDARRKRLRSADTLSIRFSSVGRAPTSAIEPSVQLDLESGTISVDGSQTAGFVIEPVRSKTDAVVKDIVIWLVRSMRSVNPPLTAL